MQTMHTRLSPNYTNDSRLNVLYHIQLFRFTFAAVSKAIKLLRDAWNSQFAMYEHVNVFVYHLSLSFFLNINSQARSRRAIDRAHQSLHKSLDLFWMFDDKSEHYYD